jgi:ABC-type nitrate/sulfonate/bicarbonate transport system permease component
MRRYLGWKAVPWLSAAALLAAWELFAQSGAVTPFMLPALSVVLERIASDAMSGELAQGLGLTLYRSLTGFAVAAAAGIILGVLFVRSRLVRWWLDPVISVGFPMPKIAFLPIITLWLGFYDVSKISMIVFDAVFPVVTATIAGTMAVEKELLWSARNLGASDRAILWEVILPASLPQVLTGLQVALPISLIVCIVAEMKMGGIGLGAAMMNSTRFADSPGVFAGIVEIAVAGYALVKLMALARRRLLLWHAEAADDPQR